MTEENNKPGSLSKLLDSTKELNNTVVKSCEDIVSVFSPPLAKTLVKLDSNFKGIYANVWKGLVNTGSKTENGDQ